MITLLVILIVPIGIYSLIGAFRMVGYLVGANLFEIGRARARARALPLPAYNPTVSLVVPVHNEGVVVERTLNNLLEVDYSPLQIIMIDDGSSDDTLWLIAGWKAEHDPDNRIQVLTQSNGGKADALNNAIQTMATGELIMCLDGDSLLAPDAIEKSVAYFRDERVVATASNVNIMPGGGILGFIQRYEYLISYHMKKAHNILNVEYIIGGIGSMFRRKTLDEVGLYDTNTMTEDIDLTMKILARGGNKTQRVAYAFDALTYTEAVPSFKSLVRQRYRWKYGRMQSFLKYWRLFFSRDRKKHSLALSWFMLPYAALQEMIYLTEPIVLATIIGLSVYYGSSWSVLAALIIISVYVSINIFGTVHLSLKDKVVLSLMSPLMYALFYVLSVVEYVALMQSIFRLPKLRQSISENNVTWQSPERIAA